MTEIFNRHIKNVEKDVWKKFTDNAKLKSLTQAEYLKEIVFKDRPASATLITNQTLVKKIILEANESVVVLLGECENNIFQRGEKKETIKPFIHPFTCVIIPNIEKRVVIYTQRSKETLITALEIQL